MELFLRLEIYTLFIFYPIIMGLLLRRKKITIKQVILITNTLVSILFETLYLYLVTLDKIPGNVFMPPLDDWITSITLSILLWLFLFLVTRPFHKN